MSYCFLTKPNLVSPLKITSHSLLPLTIPNAPLCSSINVLFLTLITWCYVFICLLCSCLFPASPYNNTISSMWARFLRFVPLISLRVDNGGWHLINIYLVNLMNKLHVNKTIRLKNKTKMKDFFIIQIIEAKYL